MCLDLRFFLFEYLHLRVNSGMTLKLGMVISDTSQVLSINKMSSEL